MKILNKSFSRKISPLRKFRYRKTCAKIYCGYILIENAKKREYVYGEGTSPVSAYKDAVKNANPMNIKKDEHNAIQSIIMLLAMLNRVNN